MKKIKTILCIITATMLPVTAMAVNVPQIDFESLSDKSSEYIVYTNQGGSWYILSSSAYGANGNCAYVYDSNDNNRVVACFSCNGATKNCHNDSNCNYVEIFDMEIDERVRESLDTDGTDAYYCARNTTQDAEMCYGHYYASTNTYHLKNSRKNLYALADSEITTAGTGSLSNCRVRLVNERGEYCKRGYYMSGGACQPCTNGAQSGIPEYHTYDQSNACKTNTTTPEICTSNQYNASNYSGLAGNCLPCPAGAKCDGEYVYCPAGSYVFYTFTGDSAPVCKSCPDGGSVANNYTSDLTDCNVTSSVELYFAASGFKTSCKYTDEIVSDDFNCAKIMGQDTTGSYIFTNSEGEYELCYYN